MFCAAKKYLIESLVAGGNIFFMAKHLEIERKFLIETLPLGWKRQPHMRIVQGYFPITSRELEIRLRRIGPKLFITIKNGRGHSRQEEEIELRKEQFVPLWPLTRSARIAKTRYRIPFSGRTIEMDVYERRHRGLVTADVEFDSIRQSKLFEPPEWFGREITGHRKYANETLARRGRLP